MVRLTDRPAMTIAVDLGRKATKPTNQILPSDLMQYIFCGFIVYMGLEVIISK